MKTFIILFLASAFTASALPASNKDYVPQHGVCRVQATLTQTDTQLNPPTVAIDVRITDGKDVELFTPTWFNGDPISEGQLLMAGESSQSRNNIVGPGERQRLMNGTASLWHVIAPGSRLKFSWARAGKRFKLPNGELTDQRIDGLEFEYTLQQGGTENGIIMWNDVPDYEWGYARCHKIDGDWIEKTSGGRFRRVRCDFNC